MVTLLRDVQELIDVTDWRHYRLIDLIDIYYYWASLMLKVWDANQMFMRSVYKVHLTKCVDSNEIILTFYDK